VDSRRQGGILTGVVTRATTKTNNDNCDDDDDHVDNYSKELNSKTKTPRSESASELHRLSDRRLSEKRLPTSADRGCHVVSVTDPYGRILGFLNRSRYFSIK
jgi:hypothetical protein